MNPQGLTVGIDVGGTFTDVFVQAPDGALLAACKAPSTPPDFATGLLQGVAAALLQAGRGAEEVTRLIHGTTVATNCILTRSGARLGFLLTEGFRDILPIGLGWRPRMYDLDMDPVEPLFLAPRRRCLGVPERMSVRGQVVAPLDETALVAAAARLVEDEGVEAIVVCYLHAYANPAHERRTRDLLQERHPGLSVTLSSDVLPRPREYRRLVVSGFDGYVKPIVNRYLEGLATRLREAGVQAPLHVMQSHGGVCGVKNLIERPVGTVLSGLAAGVIGAANLGAKAGFPDLISLDMGGTSADVALIRNGRPLVTNEGSFEHYPLNIPMVEVRTIGAGGSSIARVDAGGALRVGPDSAGADPGPACYGRGGTQPTVTDASLVLGYLNPETFAGGIVLQPERARSAIDEAVAKPLGMSVEQAALGIHAIVNANMAGALRLISIKRGYDPRDFVLLPFGGAGPLNAGRVAEASGIRRLLIPPAPGVLSAMGLILAPLRHEASAAYSASADDANSAALASICADLDRQCLARMAVDGVDPAETTGECFAEMRYVGQSHQLEVSLGERLTSAAVQDAEVRFHAAHEQTYNHRNEAAAVEFVALRATRVRPPPDAELIAELAACEAPPPAPQTRRLCLAAADGFQETPVYERAALPPGFRLSGPAILEQPDSTTLVYPGHLASVDPFGNLLIEIEQTTKEISDR